MEEIKQDESVKQVLKQYLHQNNLFRPMGEGRLVGKMPSGVYEIHKDYTGISFEKTNFKTDELLRFDDPTHNAILDEMDDFWKRKPHYEKMRFLHNRAILMFGPPGSGKSCIIKLASNDLIKKGDIVFLGRNIYDVVSGLKIFREIEPDRRCLVVMEDIDEMSEHSLLQLLDGSDAVDNIMYLATTNYVDRLPPRVLRPGRFDRKIEVSYPPEAGRRAYFEAKLKDVVGDDDIEKLVKATDGFSFGHLRELLTAVFCLGQDINHVLKRLSGAGLEVSAKFKVAASLGSQACKRLRKK